MPTCHKTFVPFKNHKGIFCPGLISSSVCVNLHFFLSYEVGTDPAGWVTVDSKTGQVSTKQILDRESSYVNDSVYTALILAVDHGKQSYLVYLSKCGISVCQRSGELYVGGGRKILTELSCKLLVFRGTEFLE